MIYTNVLKGQEKSMIYTNVLKDLEKGQEKKVTNQYGQLQNHQNSPT